MNFNLISQLIQLNWIVVNISLNSSLNIKLVLYLCVSFEFYVWPFDCVMFDIHFMQTYIGITQQNVKDWNPISSRFN